jgi:DNA integrity scanning protein DisA with diadenylate cyclase activity
VAVSRRRNIITAYYREHKHVINTINYLVTKIGRALSVLEKHRENLDKIIKQIDVEGIGVKRVNGIFETIHMLKET